MPIDVVGKTLQCWEDQVVESGAPQNESITEIINQDEGM